MSSSGLSCPAAAVVSDAIDAPTSIIKGISGQKCPGDRRNDKANATLAHANATL